MFDIIDAHVHIYPMKIAEKAAKSIGMFYDIDMDYDGTIETLFAESKDLGIKKYVVHSVATVPEQVHKINEFILSESLKHSEFIPFMTLHPSLCEEEIINEIKWCKEKGFKGIKLHPDFQKFAIDDPVADKIYRNAIGNLPILFHTGDKRYNYSHPKQLAAVAKKYPDLIVIGAHFGGYSEWENVGCYKGLKNVYFDTSSSLSYLTKEQAVGFIKEFGCDRFFFGTDYPMWSAKDEYEKFMALNLTDKERRMIFYENISKLLNL